MLKLVVSECVEAGDQRMCCSWWSVNVLKLVVSECVEAGASECVEAGVSGQMR